MDPDKRARSTQHNCIKADGTGTAGPILTPLFQAWASARRIKLVPGTWNLCSHRDVDLPSEFIALKPWDAALDFP